MTIVHKTIVLYLKENCKVLSRKLCIAEKTIRQCSFLAKTILSNTILPLHCLILKEYNCLPLLKVRQSRNVFSGRQFFQKTNKKICLFCLAVLAKIQQTKMLVTVKFSVTCFFWADLELLF